MIRKRKNMKKLGIKEIVYVGVFAAIIAALSQVSFPLPSGVPVTLQTLAIALTGALLGWKLGLCAVVVYIILGCVGVPVFAGFSGGIGVLLGSTGGYIIGFLFTGIIYIIFTKFVSKKIVVKIIALVLGLAVCYAFGTAWFMNVYIKTSGEVGLLTVLGWCVFPFIIPDLLKLALAVVIAKRIEPVIK